MHHDEKYDSTREEMAMKRMLEILSAGIASIAFSSPTSFAQSYPTKPIRLVVSSPPGGIDAYVRLFTPKAAEMLGQPIVIENRGGANGAIGADHVAKQAADGYTILFATSAPMVYGAILKKDTPFDPIRDFSPILNVLDSLKIVTVHVSLPVNSIQELIVYAKCNPGKLSYASSGIGSVFHMNGELFKLASGVDIVHIPCKGTAAMATDLVAGRAEVGFPALNNVKPAIAGGKVRVLAILEQQRYGGLPNLATLSELLPGFQPTPSWAGLFGPAGLARPIVDRLNNVFLKSLDAPDVKKFIDENGAVVAGGTPEEFAAAIRTDLELAARAVKSAGIKSE